MSRLTVREVIAALEKIEDKDLDVIAEGCDCANPVVSVDVITSGLTSRPLVYLRVDTRA